MPAGDPGRVLPHGNPSVSNYGSLCVRRNSVFTSLIPSPRPSLRPSFRPRVPRYVPHSAPASLVASLNPPPRSSLRPRIRPRAPWRAPQSFPASLGAPQHLPGVPACTLETAPVSWPCAPEPARHSQPPDPCWRPPQPPRPPRTEAGSTEPATVTSIIGHRSRSFNLGQRGAAIPSIW